MGRGKAYGIWVLFNVIGFLISQIPTPFIADYYYSYFHGRYIISSEQIDLHPLFLATGVTLGLIMGFMQIFTLRKLQISKNAFLMMTACVLGSLVALNIAFVWFWEYLDPYPLVVVYLSGGGVGGIIIGLIQSSGFRKILRKSWLWIISNTFAGLVGLSGVAATITISAMFVHDADPILFVLPTMFLGGICGALYGAISGLPLLWMKRVEAEETKDTMTDAVGEEA